jgi:hypothetical protein
MKNITPIQIWENGTVQEATVLNTYCDNLQLNQSANFFWQLFSTLDGNIAIKLSQGNLSMTGDAYTQWQTDNYAWDWVAEQLNLTIIGDYVPPVSEPIVEPIVEVAAQVEPIIEPKAEEIPVEK